MAGGKVVVNLATGLEDPERVTIAFLVAGAAAERGKQVTMFLTKDAVRLALPGVAEGVACDGLPAARAAVRAVRGGGRRAARLPDLLQRAQARRGRLVANAQIGGATPLWDWIGDEPATVFSY